MQQISAHTKTKAMQAIEAEIGRPLDVALREMYVEQGQTTVQIAAVLGIENSTVSRWLAHFGIPTRLYGPRRVAAA